jgi:hypothetical protein
MAHVTGSSDPRFVRERTIRKKATKLDVGSHAVRMSQIGRLCEDIIGRIVQVQK